MNFVGTGARLAPSDFARAGRLVGLSEDIVKAVVEVEAAGRGFDAQRRPKILFEPHIFYRRLGKGVKRDRAVRGGLAYAKWGAKPYPRTSDLNYQRLQAAMKIDARKAIESTSWGLPQIMGFNFADAGYGSPEEMVEDFKTGERAQLAALIRLIDAWQLEDDLQRLDWRSFARRYNGAGFEKNGYHTKLAGAYEKHSRIPDAPFDDAEDVPVDVRGPVRVPMPVPRPAEITIEFDEPIEVPEDPPPALAVKAQELLKAKGYHEVGMVGTGWGDRSKDTLAAWKASWNRRHPDDQVPVSDVVTDDIVRKLEGDQPRTVAPERASASVEELPPETKTLTKSGSWISRVLVFLGIGGGVGEGVGLIDQAEELSYGWLRIRGILDSIGLTLAEHWPFFLIGGGVLVWLIVQHIQNKNLALVRDGRLLK